MKNFSIQILLWCISITKQCTSRRVFVAVCSLLFASVLLSTQCDNFACNVATLHAMLQGCIQCDGNIACNVTTLKAYDNFAFNMTSFESN